MSCSPGLLVVLDPGDAGGMRVAGLLATRHGAYVRVATAADLVFGSRVTYRSCHGSVSAQLVLADGTVVDSASLQAVLFRAAVTAAPWSARASAADAEYAAVEAYALLLAWLAALPCPVLNAPSGQGLAGPAWTPIQWLGLAARAGLPVVATRTSTDFRAHGVRGWERSGSDGSSATVPIGRRAASQREPLEGPETRVLVVDGEAGDALPDRLRTGCAALAEASGCRLLSLTVGRTPRGQVVTGVDPLPALDGPGEAALAAGLLERLAAGGGRR